MKYFFLFINFLFGTLNACAQIPTERPYVVNPEFDNKISKTISFSVPVISPEQLKKMDNVVILDAREQEEYDISHIENARFVGYKHFKKDVIADVPKDATVVLYCTIGYRSEKLGAKLKKFGYKNVYNLYGSIFEWVNQGNKVVDKNGNITNKVHTYNKAWSKWLNEDKGVRVW